MLQLFMKAKETGSYILYDLWKLLFLIILHSITVVITCKANWRQYIFHAKKQRCAKTLLSCHETHLRNINLLFICLPGFASNNISTNLSRFSYHVCRLPTRKSPERTAFHLKSLFLNPYKSRSKESDSPIIKPLSSPGYLINHPASIQFLHKEEMIRKGYSPEQPGTCRTTLSCILYPASPHKAFPSSKVFTAASMIFFVCSSGACCTATLA